MRRARRRARGSLLWTTGTTPNTAYRITSSGLVLRRPWDWFCSAVDSNALSFDIQQREKLRDAYTSLYLAYQQIGADNPQQKALDGIITGRKIIELGNGQKRLVDERIDEAAVQKAIEEVRINWNALGIFLPNGVTIAEISIDKFSPQFVGNKLMFFSPNKIPLKVRSKNGDRAEILQIDLSDYKISVDTGNNDPADRPDSWNGRNFTAPATEKGWVSIFPKGYDSVETT
jgi:hypothetical protein